MTPSHFCYDLIATLRAMPKVRGVLACSAVAAVLAGAIVASRVLTDGLPGGTATGPSVESAPVPGASWLANPAPPAGDFTTVALDSFAAGPAGSRAAAARVRELRAAGFEAAALDSSRYNSLEPGFLLVYSGVFPGDDLPAAERHATTLRAAGVTRHGYARHVSCWSPCVIPERIGPAGQVAAG
jgi:hypothetical protein